MIPIGEMPLFGRSMLQDLPPHGMFPLGEKVQIEHTLDAALVHTGWLRHMQSCDLSFPGEILVLTLILGLVDV